MGLWVETRGEHGVEPTGNLKRVVDLLQQASRETSEATRVKLAKQILNIAFVDEMWCIGTVGLSPRVVVAADKLANVPSEVAFSGTAYTPGNAHPEQFFYTSA